MAYGDMKHRKWFKGRSGRDAPWRKLSARIEVRRVGDTGEAKPKPYRAIACIGKHSQTRKPATRCGEARGKTPTLAIRGAFKDLGRNFK